jgi:hypothetical protein
MYVCVFEKSFVLNHRYIRNTFIFMQLNEKDNTHIECVRIEFSWAMEQTL